MDEPWTTTDIAKLCNVSLGGNLDSTVYSNKIDDSGRTWDGMGRKRKGRRKATASELREGTATKENNDAHEGGNGEITSMDRPGWQLCKV